MIVRDFDPSDVEAIEVQPIQRTELMAGSFYAANGPAWTVTDASGRILACLGLMVAGPGYRLAWALMATGKRNALVPLTRAVRRVLNGGDWRRVEMQTRPEFAEAADWAVMLGFQLEGVKRCALADGGDLLVWARIRGD